MSKSLSNIFPKTHRTPPMPKIVKPLKTFNKDDITLKDLTSLWSVLEPLITITEWKTKVKEFKEKFSLTDLEAISLANKKF